jgi:hypothetical protein
MVLATELGPERHADGLPASCVQPPTYLPTFCVYAEW